MIEKIHTSGDAHLIDDSKREPLVSAEYNLPIITATIQQ